MRIWQVISSIAVVGIVFSLSGCGSSDVEQQVRDALDEDSSLSENSQTVIGTFVDDPVEGLDYSCSTGLTGKTDSQGQFTCKVDDDVTFSIGAVDLGTVPANSGTITPYTLFPSDHDAAIALARVIQSLDADGDRSNDIITIDETLSSLLPSGVDLRDVASIGLIEELLPSGLVSAEDAREHLDSQLRKAGLEIPDVMSTEAWYSPDINATWQWQMKQGEDEMINISYDVDVYDIDLFDSSIELITALHEDGRYVLCHFSAGSYDLTEEETDSFPEVALGYLLSEDSEERWLDISDIDLQPLMQERFDLALEKGCDGVVPENVDAYDSRNQPGIELSYDEQLTYNLWLAEQAHERGLAIGLMNDLEQIEDLVPYFDLSVNEECNYFDECDRLQPFIDAGKPVFHVEYDERYVTNIHDYRERLCAEIEGDQFQTLVLPISLDDTFRFTCE